MYGKFLRPDHSLGSFFSPKKNQNTKLLRIEFNCQKSLYQILKLTILIFKRLTILFSTKIVLSERLCHKLKPLNKCLTKKTQYMASFFFY